VLREDILTAVGEREWKSSDTVYKGEVLEEKRSASRVQIMVRLRLHCIAAVTPATPQQCRDSNPVRWSLREPL